MLEPGQTIGPFLIEKVLGSGAMGTVYKAKYTETGKTVAVKFIALGLLNNPTALDRFEREADILKQLRHPHIVRLFGTGRYKNTPYFAMEFVRGEPLDEVLERRGRLPWEEVVRLGKELCQALRHAHEKGIIHRDLKPSNLMILKDGMLKLTDFGIAKDTDVTALTGANSTVGTAAYMSPEQCRGEKSLTLKSDLYSLGIVFYELLTGDKPFKKDTPVEMFLAHVNEPFERPGRLVLDIPPWLDTLVCQLMEKSPDKRPLDAGIVERALEEIETKAAEQRSAGLDVATARVADRPGQGRGDEADREAARILRGGKKRRPRAKVEPFYRKTWFTAATLVLALAGLGGVGWWLSRPQPPEAFVRRAEAAKEAGDAEALRAVLQEFTDTYPNLDTDDSRRMRSWHEDVEADHLARQMHNRLRKSLNPDGDPQQLAFSAIRAEDAGNLADARRRWTDLAELVQSDQKADQQAYAWLCRKKLKAIDETEAAGNRLVKDGVLVTFPTDSEAARAAVLAARFERFGDATEALARWTKVRDDFLKEYDARPPVVIAAFRANELKALPLPSADDAKAVRNGLVQRALAQVDKVMKIDAPASRREATAICSDITELYGADPDPELKRLVDRAKERLASFKGR